MDDIALYYDPRNAPFAGWPHAFGMPQPQPQPQPQPRMYYAAPPLVRPAAPTQTPSAPIKVLGASPTAQPAMFIASPYGYPPGAYQNTGARRFWRDLSAGDVISLATQVVTAFRTLPPAPADRGDANTNIVNGVAFLDAIAKHFKSAAQLHALANVAGRLVG